MSLEAVPKLALSPDDDQKLPPSYDDDKKLPVTAEDVDEKALGSEKESASSEPDHLYVNGEPVISTGEDVSNFLVDVHDAGGDALTFRSIVLGTLLSGFGASVTQVRWRAMDTIQN